MIETATETQSKTSSASDKGNYLFKNNENGYYKTKIINTEITSNTNGDANDINSNLTFNVGNLTLAQYNKNSGDNSNNETKVGLNDSTLYGDFSNNQSLSYLNKLDSSTTLYNPVEEINKSWDQTNRGLTQAGQAVVAITATALTMGAMDPVSGSWVQGALVGGSSAAASTAAISVTNAALNADGDIFKQLKDISKETWDNTTSKESVKNIIIAATAGGLATGLTNIAGGGTFTTPATTTNTVAANASTFERVSTNLKTSFTEVAANTVASSAAQSAINGDNFVESLQNQATNILVYTIAKVGANEIGRAAHGVENKLRDSNGNTLTNLDGSTMKSPQINQLTQLTLHAGLGALTSSLTGGDATSGAFAGVVGELTAEALKDSIKSGDVSKNTAIQLAGMSGSLSSILTSTLTNQSDEETANGIWNGQRIGGNAAENNAYFALRPLKGSPWLGILSNNKLGDITNTEVAHEQLFFEDAQGGNLGYFDDSKVKSDSPEQLGLYRPTLIGFDDSLMREAVKNVEPKPYNLLDMKNFCSGKYNCQDWAEDVRKEYYKLEKQKR